MIDLVSDRLSNIDVMRGIAAAAVCAFHFSRGEFLGSGAVQHTAEWGHLGVEVFFVISGFVIPVALQKGDYARDQAGRFLFARFIRLYPAYLCTCILTIGLWFASALAPGFRGSSPQFTLASLAANATLTADWFGQEWLIPTAWTLAIEAQYYVIVALCFRWLISPRLELRLATVLLWSFAPVLLPLKALLFGYGALFALGMLAFLRRSRLLPAQAGYVLVGVATVVQGRIGGPASALAALGTYAILVYLPQIRNAPLIGLGTISYSLYLMHAPIGGRVINLGERWASSAIAKSGMAVLAFGASLLVAYILFRTVEKPSHTAAHTYWKKKRGQRRYNG